MFQESELINFCISLITLIIVISVIRKNQIPDFAWFYAGFCCIFAASVFTVVEGAVYHELFDTLEHFSYTLGALFFAAGCIRGAVKESRRQGKEPK